MARAMVRIVQPYGKGGQGRERAVCLAYFLGSDVPDDINSEPYQVDVFMTGATWNIARLKAAINDTVLAKASELGLTLSNNDILSDAVVTRLSGFAPAALRTYWVQKDSGNVTTFSPVGLTALPTASGTATAIFTDPDGQFISYASPSTIGAQAGWRQSTAPGTLTRRFLPRKVFVFKTPADITNARFWFGLWGVGTMDADAPAIRHAAVRGSSVAGDVNWVSSSGDGAAPTLVDTGVPFTANTPYVGEIDLSVPNEISYYLQQKYCGTITTDLPTIDGVLLPGALCYSQVAAARSFLISHWMGQSL